MAESVQKKVVANTHIASSPRQWAVPLAIPGGGAPGPRIRARAFGRIEDTLSVLDEGAALTHQQL
jgi:hypothetical protein